MGAWFFAFAYSKDRLRDWRVANGKGEKLELGELLVSGSLAGIAFWAGKDGVSDSHGYALGYAVFQAIFQVLSHFD